MTKQWALQGYVFQKFNANRHWLVGVLEQSIVAATSLASMAIMSREIGIHETGIVAIGLVLWMLIEALQRAVVILPLTAGCPRPELDRQTFGSFIVLNVSFTGLCSIFLFVLGFAILPFSKDIGVATTLAAPMAFCGSLFLFLRQALYLMGRPGLALVNAAGVATVTLSGLLLIHFVWALNATAGAIVISTGYGVSSLVLTIWLLTRANFSWENFTSLTRHRRSMLEYMTASLALLVATSGAQLLLGVVSGPSSVAVFSFARTLVRPITLILHAVVDTERSRMARQCDEHGTGVLPHHVKIMQLTLLLLCIVPTLAILLWPAVFLKIFYGDNGTAAASAARLWALAAIPMIVASPLEAALSIARDSRAVARANLLAMFVMIFAVAIALAFGRFTADAAVISVGLAYAAALASLYHSYSTKMTAPSWKKAAL
ncbi:MULTISPECIES: lipopolysaccharide biosynthesis protein [unclassified Rhizobium]|uniref:lipopolysaccharide biosynthesis protein n=1 Tax=unclassified Rhizobium TaxID=2613769 RepID=UPI001ADB7609|nr:MULTISPECIES: hypothetical protein [unclassified Rhizobium]MBO9099411.1 hypothetical protein [Rhizobium sp. L58/93]QXZ87103.1 hypothetical protein J5287_21185 [Rhizobium sp. K1/93]QXZ92863.1 hypothetical protein J5280_19710 [Rhizobium sp. K15/93]